MWVQHKYLKIELEKKKKNNWEEAVKGLTEPA